MQLRVELKSAAPPAACGPVLIFGLPRSGTTWLAKIFDSHPDTLYRHEPDHILRGAHLPFACTAAEARRRTEDARAYAQALLNLSTAKTAGSIPVFSKRYRLPLGRPARAGMALALSAATRTPLLRRAVARVPVSDLIAPWRREQVRIVMKSVSGLGRAGMLADALPSARVILLMRDPRGQAASVLRGERLGMFDNPTCADEMLHFGQAARYGLTPARVAAMPLVERLAWNWVVQNEQAIQDLGDRPNVVVLRYEDLCRRPQACARELLAFARLPWHPQTEAFIDRSSAPGTVDRYYSVFKDAATALSRWRKDLSADDQRRIRDIVRSSSLALLYDVAEAAAGA